MFDCEYAPAEFWVAEIVVLPEPTITNDVPSTVATFGLEEK